MNKPILTFFIFLFVFSSKGQPTASWVWGIADTTDVATGNPAATQHVAAASGNKILWAMLQNEAVDYSSFYFGSYKLTAYDNTSAISSWMTIGGKLFISSAQADAAGNWYILGQYYDSLIFPTGPTFVNPTPTSSEPYFIARINGSTMICEWAKIIGNAAAFTVTDNGLYVSIDSVSTYICKFDLNTGARTNLFSQAFTSSTTSIAVDESENVYLAGGCAFSGVNFNGHVVSTTGVPYPVYIVKYAAGGAYEWHYLMSDISCPSRQLNLAGDNAIYYSGKIFDSFTLGGHFVHQPRWVYDYLVSRIDSAGNVQWVKQQKDTAEGDADADNLNHAVVMADSSLSVFAQTRGYIDWGNGIIINNGSNTNNAVINYSTTGAVSWVKQADGEEMFAKNIVSNGTDIWVTGNVYDSTGYNLDATVVMATPITNTPYMAMLRTYTIPSAVNNIEEQDQVKIMPVPATNILTIKIPANTAGDVRIRLCDVSGRLVLETITNGSISTQQLDVSRYSRGLYFIDISGNNFRNVKKLILE